MASPRTELPPASLDGAAFRWSMGLHRLDDAAWLDVDEHRDEELAAKSRLLAEQRDAVLATLPEGDDASAELLGLVVENLSAHHADASTGDPSPNVGGRHPIEAASLRVQEDLCVLVRDADAWRLVAACVCFPSRWLLREKLGATLAAIHDPVPGFDTSLAGPAATFFDRLTAARSVWRSNWTLLDTAELHLPSASARRAPRPPDGDVGSHLWFRVERQTLRRLPSSGGIVFTIRTTVRPLADALASVPGAAAALRETLSTVPDEVATYKGWVGLLAPLHAWLGAPESPAAGR